MSDSEGPARPAPGKRRRRRSWRGYFWYALGFLLIGIAVLSWTARALLPPAPDAAITRRIMPQLAPVEKIDAAPGALDGWNVLLITADTTRADHLHCYGNRAIETPTIDRLAREGVLAATAATPVPATLPGHSSLLTGLNPYNHGARANGTFRLEDDRTTLAELLGRSGYRTGAAISAFVLDSRYGLDQGFDAYDDDLTVGMKYARNMFRERAAELTNRAVFEWLRAHGQEKFFYWVHYFDPHAPYLPPEPYRSDYARMPYDGEIAYLDAQIGKLLDMLVETGVADRTLVVFTSDHGEGLGEHGELTHSLLLHDATMHVPLIVHAPGPLPTGQVLTGQVSLVDVMPTVLDLLGQPVPEGLDGVSLLRAARAPDRAPDRAVYLETLATMTLHGWAPLLGVRRQDYKFVLAPTPEVYDLKEDPRELTNLFADRPDLAVDLQDVLKGFVGEDPYLATTVNQNMPLDEEAIRKLEALGYMGVAKLPGEGRPFEHSNLDPKDMLSHWQTVESAAHLRAQGRTQEAIEQLEACLEEVPEDVFARQMLVSTYVLWGDMDKAIALCEETVALAPGDDALRLNLASAYVERGRIGEAEQIAQEVLARQPESSEAHLVLARVAMRRRNDEAALAHFQEAIELDPGQAGPSAYVAMGVRHRLAGRTDEARECFDRALEIDALNGAAHNGLATLLIDEEELDEALALIDKGLRFDPAQPLALSTRAAILSRQRQYEPAIAACRQAMQVTSDYSHAHNSLGLTYRRMGKLEEAEASYRRAIEADPPLDAAHVNLAQLYLVQAKETEAMAQFTAALDMNPFNTISLANLGTYHFKHGRHGEAQRLFVRTLRVDPGYAMVHKYLAMILYDRKELTAAVSHLQRSLELDPEQVDAGLMRYQIDQWKAEEAAGSDAAEPGQARAGDGAEGP